MCGLQYCCLFFYVLFYNFWFDEDSFTMNDNIYKKYMYNWPSLCAILAYCNREGDEDDDDDKIMSKKLA